LIKNGIPILSEKGTSERKTESRRSEKERARNKGKKKILFLKKFVLFSGKDIN
jgi:hypothetical protein